jgi:hypothetical protein
VFQGLDVADDSLIKTPIFAVLIPNMPNIYAAGIEPVIIDSLQCQGKFDNSVEMYLRKPIMQIINVCELRQKCVDGGSTVLVEISGFKKGYETAGTMVIYPENIDGSVVRMLKIIGHDGQDLVHVKNLNQSSTEPLPSPISLKDLFKKFYDLNSEIK